MQGDLMDIKEPVLFYLIYVADKTFIIIPVHSI